MDQITISSKQLRAAVIALGRSDSPVYSAHKEGRHIVILFCPDTEPMVYTPPSKRKRANVLPVEVLDD